MVDTTEHPTSIESFRNLPHEQQPYPAIPAEYKGQIVGHPGEHAQMGIEVTSAGVVQNTSDSSFRPKVEIIPTFEEEAARLLAESRKVNPEEANRWNLVGKVRRMLRKGKE